MKSMRPPSAAIFFMTYFYRAGGPWPPRPPPDPLLSILFTVRALILHVKFSEFQRNFGCVSFGLAVSFLFIIVINFFSNLWLEH